MPDKNKVNKSVTTVKNTRTTCKALRCTSPLVKGAYCAVHYRHHRRYDGMEVKGDT